MFKTNDVFNPAIEQQPGSTKIHPLMQQICTRIVNETPMWVVGSYIDEFEFPRECVVREGCLKVVGRDSRMVERFSLLIEKYHREDIATLVEAKRLSKRRYFYMDFDYVPEHPDNLAFRDVYIGDKPEYDEYLPEVQKSKSLVILNLGYKRQHEVLEWALLNKVLNKALDDLLESLKVMPLSELNSVPIPLLRLASPLTLKAIDEYVDYLEGTTMAMIKTIVSTGDLPEGALATFFESCVEGRTDNQAVFSMGDMEIDYKLVLTIMKEIRSECEEYQMSKDPITLAQLAEAIREGYGRLYELKVLKIRQ